MKIPQISIITAAYDGERFLSRTLESVRSGTRQDWEHVIVDDGSRDGTWKIAEAAARTDSRVRVISQPNAGVAAARNSGLAASDPGSAYLLFLDQDDLLCTDALNRLAGHLDRHPDAVAVFGAAGRVDESDAIVVEELDLCLYGAEHVGKRVRLIPSQEQRLGFSDLIGINPIPTPGMCLIRRAALTSVGDFDPAVAPCDDWDLWLRLALSCGESEKPLHRIAGRTLMWRTHDGCQSRQWDLMRRRRRMVYEKYLCRPDTAALTRAVLPLGLYGLDAGYWGAAGRDAIKRRRFGSALICLSRWMRRSYACLLLQGWQRLQQVQEVMA